MPRLCSSLLLSLIIASSASAISTVVPNANASVEGNLNNVAPFRLFCCGMRYQQVFAASQFSGAMSIGQIALRNDSQFGEPFTATMADIKIWLSTVSANPDALSTTFDDNIGADNTQVYDGSLTLSSTNAAGPGNTRVFDVLINLQQSFYYDPSLGNLLLEIRNVPGVNAYFPLDAVFEHGDSVSRLLDPNGDPNAATGTPDTLGLVVRFDTVPEPSTGLLVIAGLLGLAGWRRTHA